MSGTSWLYLKAIHLQHAFPISLWGLLIWILYETIFWCTLHWHIHDLSCQWAWYAPLPHAIRHGVVFAWELSLAVFARGLSVRVCPVTKITLQGLWRKIHLCVNQFCNSYALKLVVASVGRVLVSSHSRQVGRKRPVSSTTSAPSVACLFLCHKCIWQSRSARCRERAELVPGKQDLYAKERLKVVTLKRPSQLERRPLEPRDFQRLFWIEYHAPQTCYPPEKSTRTVCWLPAPDFRAFSKQFGKLPNSYCICVRCVTLSA